MRWIDLERQQPRLAEVGRNRLLKPGVVLIATIRRDGTPRVSPAEPYVLDGELWFGLLWQSTKVRDLLRDPRLLVHSVVTGRDGAEGEFKIRGTAVAVDDAGAQRRYADAVARDLGWDPEPGKFHLFRVDIDDVTYLRYDSASEAQHTTRWPGGVEYVRPNASATSLGAAEPVRDLLD